MQKIIRNVVENRIAEKFWNGVSMLGHGLKLSASGVYGANI